MDDIVQAQREFMKELESEYFDWCVNHDPQFTAWMEFIQYQSVVELGNQLNMNQNEGPVVEVNSPETTSGFARLEPKRDGSVNNIKGTLLFLMKQLDNPNSYINWIDKNNRIFIIKSFKCLDIEYRFYQQKRSKKQRLITRYVLRRNINYAIRKGRIKKLTRYTETHSIVYQFLFQE